MITLPPLPSIPVVRAGLITRRLKLAGPDGPGLHVVATGRTGSGKTTIGNRLLGLEYFLSSGDQDCTREVNFVRFPGGLSYADLPGVCSDDRLENYNRAALGLSQVAEFPTITDLTVAEYNSDGSPFRKVLRATEFPAAYPAPNVILYVLAADKQFTSADRQYLEDLLSRHQRVLYVLNVFANSPPTEANVHDVVREVAAVHRQVVAGGDGPRVVAVDCRTGDGLADLLVAVRDLPGESGGPVLADLIADQERETPRCYAKELRRYLAVQAVAVAALRAGPIGTEHSLHRFTAAIQDALDALRAGATPAAVSCASRYQPIVAAAAAPAIPARAATPASVSTRAAGLIEVADRIQEAVSSPAVQARKTVMTAAQATFQAISADVERREAAFAAALADLKSADVALAERYAEFERAREEVERRIADHNAEADRIRSRQVAHSGTGSEHDYERDRYDDRLEAFNEAIEQINKGATVDDYTRRQLEREADRLNRERDRLNRRAASWNRELSAIHAAIDEFHDGQHALEDQLRNLRALQEACQAASDTFHRQRMRLAREELDHRRQSTAEEWAEQRFVGPCNQMVVLLDQLCKTLVRELEQTVARARELRRLANLARFNSEAAESELEDRQTRLEAMVPSLTEATAKIRRLWADFVLNRAANALLLRAATDHFDEANGATHRGTTYSPLGLDGAAYVLAAGQLAVFGRDMATEYPPLYQAVRSALANLPGQITSGGTLRDPDSLSDCFAPEFDRALTRLAVFAG